MNENRRFDPYIICSMPTAFNLVVWLLFDGLKSIVTIWIEPTALQYRLYL